MFNFFNENLESEYFFKKISEIIDEEIAANASEIKLKEKKFLNKLIDAIMQLL